MKPVMTIRCAALTLASILATSALADGSPERIPQRVVRFDDLNLQSKSGINALYRRIRWASDMVCREDQGVRRLVLQEELEICKADSLDRAIAQVNLPSLSSLHFARTGRKVPDAQVARKN
jgi:UrcA family protein